MASKEGTFVCTNILLALQYLGNFIIILKQLLYAILILFIHVTLKVHQRLQQYIFAQKDLNNNNLVSSFAK